MGGIFEGENPVLSLGQGDVEFIRLGTCEWEGFVGLMGTSRRLCVPKLDRNS